MLERSMQTHAKHKKLKYVVIGRIVEFQTPKLNFHLLKKCKLYLAYFVKFGKSLFSKAVKNGGFFTSNHPNVFPVRMLD